jgi:excisionase family DNA binding protein
MNRTGEPVAIETPYITRIEAAKYLCVNPRTVDRRIKEGVLKHYRFGRSVLLVKEDLDEYLRNQA